MQASPNNHLDLWAREHFKSTIITYAKTIQDILIDPEVTVGIFSHTRPIAKAFLRQIMREFEGNELLKYAFDDVLWKSPRKEAPKWSEDEGIVVKRKSNPKESTVEAWGLVDGQPTSKHYKLMVYDDTVTRESITTPEMIDKVTDAWALSRNLASEGGTVRYIGTRYHFNDTYAEILKRGAAKPRIYPATEDGTVEGEPVLMSRERLAEKYREMGVYVFGCQMLQNPTADKVMGFQEKWLRFYDGDLSGDRTNNYILCDPASEKKKDSDYTSFWVWGLGEDGNLYVLDIIRDRLNPTERIDALFGLHRKWRPKLIGYEKYGLMSDTFWINERQKADNYRFEVVELGGPQPKPDRIRRLVPYFEQGKIWLPKMLHRIDYQNQQRDLINDFVNEEYLAFPVSRHDDMLDAASRLFDEDMKLRLVWPKSQPKKSQGQRAYAGAGGWMGT